MRIFQIFTPASRRRYRTDFALFAHKIPAKVEQGKMRLFLIVFLLLVELFEILEQFDIQSMFWICKILVIKKYEMKE